MGAVRRAVIFVAQILALIFIVAATMAGALASDDWLIGTAPFFGGLVSLVAGAPVSIAGAIAGFFVSTVLSALFFLLIEIAHNTRNPFSS
ncbi:MAG TPA: hypothetical protein VFB29_13275 [Pseudolabrys sp.]|nr:hypothetical protein [Pseudolabrys sp.]